MDLLTPTIYALLAGVATLTGMLLTSSAENFVKRYSFVIVSLAAGVLLGTTFFHIVPEAEELIGHNLYIWLLLGFGLFYVLESLIGCHCYKKNPDHDEGHALGSITSARMLFHSLLDGVAIAIGFEVNPTLGLITALAVIIHELPEGIFTLSILLHSGMKKSKALWWTVAVALATPMGAILTLVFFPDLSETTLGALLAIAGGSFLYIAAADLIPESHRKRSLTTGAFVVLGVLFVLAVSSLTEH